jgi:hypothetical protein
MILNYYPFVGLYLAVSKKINNTASDLNISTNNKYHADSFVRNKRPGGETIEFDVPKWLDDQIKVSAVPQYKAPSNLKNLTGDAPEIVDFMQTGNPFELPSKWHKLIEQNYIKGSAKIVK